MSTNLSKKYNDEIKPLLKEKFGYKNIMQVPKIEKISLNIGLGRAVADSKEINSAIEDMALISGQRPVVTRAKKSIAGFKLRAGMPIGVKVTLRGNQMYQFLERFINIALPRVRDFRGLSAKAFDGNGNFAFGLKEQLIFPEIDYDKVDKVRGMDINIVTTAKNNEEAKELLKAFNMPFYN